MAPIVFVYRIGNSAGSELRLLNIHSDGSVSGDNSNIITCIKNNLPEIARDKSVCTENILNHAVNLSMNRNIDLSKTTEMVLQAIKDINS